MYKKKFYCFCGAEIGSQAKRCASCNYKWMSENKINTGNYKTGSHCTDHFCIDCGKLLVKPTAKRCSECYKKVLIQRLKENPVNKGRTFSEEHIEKLSLAKIGKPSPNKGITLTFEQRLKLSIAHGGDGKVISSHLPNRGYTSDFKYISKEIIQRDNSVCFHPECNCFTNDPTVHHIDYNRIHNDKSNLITLCRKHNSCVNVNKEYWKLYFQNKILQLLKEK